MLAIQYDLFKSEEQSEYDCLLKEFENVKQSTDRVRRGIFARHNELAKEFLILKQEHELLIKNICNGSARV